MWRPDTNELALRLGQEFGLQLEGSTLHSEGDWPSLELRPEGMRREIAFAVRCELGWRNVSLSLNPGAFAGPLVDAMGRADETARQTFVDLARRLISLKADISLSVNGENLDPVLPEEWPGIWQRLELKLTKSPAIVNTEDADANNEEVHVWTRRFLSLALALMPLEELEPEEVVNPDGLPEGACIRIEANRYERSRINRAACIEIHGESCLVCDFNFEREFGEAGRGFIHVHHVTPVSELGPGYRINPAADLVPLCPNCHAMAHRFQPPASVQDLREIVGTSELGRENSVSS